VNQTVTHIAVGAALQYYGLLKPCLPAFTILQALRASGPLAITIWADSNPSMQFYKGGVYSHPDSPLAGEDHALVLVGWGEEKMVNGTIVPFWIIANSWGNTWWVGVGQGQPSLRLPVSAAALRRTAPRLQGRGGLPAHEA